MTPPPTQHADAVHGGMRDAKRELRSLVLSARDQMPDEARAEASRSIVAALTARPDFRASQTLLLTLSFGSEWDTVPLVEAALARNKTVVLPRVNLATNLLDLCTVTDLERDVAPGYRGIREPLPHCAQVDLAAIRWVLVPGVAFDRDGRRLGYGGGFYDRLLPSLSTAAVRVAGAFESQIVDQVPAVVHDLAVDAIVTEVRTLSPAR